MVIKVERGKPTPEELAAVVALVQARAAALDAEEDGPVGKPMRLVGPGPQPPPGAAPPGPRHVADVRVAGWSGLSTRTQAPRRRPGATWGTCCGRKINAKSTQRRCATH